MQVSAEKRSCQLSFSWTTRTYLRRFMDGYEAAKQIRGLDDKKKASIPIVAVTANAFEEDRKIALEAGMNGHLAKPYDIPAIMETLKDLLK